MKYLKKYKLFESKDDVLKKFKKIEDTREELQKEMSKYIKEFFNKYPKLKSLYGSIYIERDSDNINTLSNVADVDIKSLLGELEDLIELDNPEFIIEYGMFDSIQDLFNFCKKEKFNFLPLLHKINQYHRQLIALNKLLSSYDFQYWYIDTFPTDLKYFMAELYDWDHIKIRDDVKKDTDFNDLLDSEELGLL